MTVVHSAFTQVLGSAALALALAGCQQVPMLPGVSTYRIDVQQGNVVTQDMVSKLKPGMTRQQVRFVLGTPPVVDPFRQDRWDYVYYYNKGGKVVEHRRLALFFDGEILKKIEGDVVPTTDQTAAGSTPGGVQPKPATTFPEVPASDVQ